MAEPQEIPISNPDVDRYAFGWCKQILLGPQVQKAMWESLEMSDLANKDIFSQRLNNLSPNAILALNDSTCYAGGALNKDFSYKDWVFIFYDRRDDIHRKMTELDIPYYETIHSHNDIWNQEYKLRLQFIADTKLSAQARRALATKLGIPSDATLFDKPAERAQLLYTHLRVRLRKLTSADDPVAANKAHKEGDLNLSDYRLPDIIYKTYRDGEYAGQLDRTATFDAMVHYLMIDGDLYIGNDGRSVDPRKGFLNSELLGKMRKRVAGWHKLDIHSDRTGKILREEIFAAAERIGMYYGAPSMRKKNDLNLVRGGNIGSLLGIGPVLTEKTRAWVVQSRRARKGYRAASHQSHPDKNADSEEKFKAVNAAYKVIQDPYKFERWQSGASMFSL